MMKKLSVFILALAMVFTGCANNVDTPEENQQTSQQVETTDNKNITDNTLTLFMGNVSNLNPLLNNDEYTDEVLKLVFEPLVTIDESFKVVPNIAESWSFSEDGLTLNVNIKKGLKWHNGNDINGADVVFSLNTITNAEADTMYKKCVANVVSYTATGEYSVAIRFNGVYSGNIYALCFPLISSRYYSGENVLTSSKNNQPMGNSVFKFESFTPAKEMMLEKTENSFKDLPNIDRVRVKVMWGENIQVNAFHQGVIDAVSLSSTQLASVDRSSSNVKQQDFSTNYFDFIGFNFNNSILAQKNIRKAISHSVPRDNMVESIYLKHATATSVPVNPNSWLYNSEIKQSDYRLDQARTILDENGWTVNSSTQKRYKISESTIEELSFSILVNKENEERVQVARRIQEELNSIGFDITLESVNYDTYAQRLSSGQFDIFVGGWNMSIDTDIRFMLHTNYIGSTNYISYSNETMDSLLYTASIATTDESLLTSYHSLQNFIAEEMPYLGLCFRDNSLYLQSQIGGTFSPTFYNSYNGIEKWVISQ